VVLRYVRYLLYLLKKGMCHHLSGLQVRLLLIITVSSRIHKLGLSTILIIRQPNLWLVIAR